MMRPEHIKRTTPPTPGEFIDTKQFKERHIEVSNISSFPTLMTTHQAISIGDYHGMQFLELMDIS